MKKNRQIVVSISIALFLLCCSASGQTKNALDDIRPYLVGFSVPNADKSAKWYIQNLGFKLLVRVEATQNLPKIVVVEIPGIAIEFVQKGDSADVPRYQQRSRSGPVHGMFKVGFSVADLDKAFAGLKSSGNLVQPITDAKRFGRRFFIVRDNNGFMVQVFQASPNEASRKTLPSFTAAPAFGVSSAHLQQANELAGAERSFAALAQVIGVRNAFLANFAQESVRFSPRPQPAYPAYSKEQPDPNDQLEWFPIFTDVAVSGELGYNIGPFTYVAKGTDRPPVYGYFFSVWKKKNGSWKVVLDIGIRLTSKPSLSEADWVSASRAGTPGSGTAMDLTLLDARLAASVAQLGGTNAFHEVAHPTDFRLLVNGHAPITTWEQTALFLEQEGLRSLEFVPKDSDISQLGDLGYSWGEYRVSGKRADEGYYLHIWKRGYAQEWKLAAELRKSVPLQVPQ